MSRIGPLVISLLGAALVIAHATTDALTLQRSVNGRALVSADSPKATLDFGKGFTYLGGQRFTLYGIADAEQHFFVHTAADGKVDRFYWIQFEHYLSANNGTYNYKTDRTTEIGGLTFLIDTEGYRDYSAANGNPDSDGAKARDLFARHGLTFPKKAARVRMIHLPNPDRHSELMIIYGEALPDSRAAFSGEGVALDSSSPELAKRILQRALEGLKITKR